jgi:putative effector of murein hydrolase
VDWILSNFVVLFVLPILVGLTLIFLIVIAFRVAIKKYESQKNAVPLLGVVLPNEIEKKEKK